MGFAESGENIRSDGELLAFMKGENGSSGDVGDMSKYIKYQHVNLLDRAYMRDDAEFIYILLTWLGEAGKEWLGSGYADEKYLTELAGEWAQRSIEDDKQDLTSYFLSFKEKLTESDTKVADDPFGEFVLCDFTGALEGTEDCDIFGNKNALPVYYSCGRVIKFGRYKSSSLGHTEPLEWIIIDREEDRALLLSRLAIDIKPFNDYYENMSWENCSLRQWLGEYFYETAFTGEEKELIVPARLRNGKGEGIHGAVPEEIYHDTFDRVFLLSADEIKLYLEGSSAIKAEGTDFVKAKNVPSVIGGFYRWWGRSMGINSSSACVVDYSWVNGYGENINSGGIGVRPSIWVKLP